MTQEDRLINLNRIGIGTVQWSEKDYGISSKARKFDINIIKKTIKLAKLNNIDTYDTAYSYNNAEKILGNCITHENVKIVTKTSKYKDTENINSDVDNIISNFHESLDRLNKKNVYALLIHDPQILLDPIGYKIWKALLVLKKNKKIKKLGVSIYSPEQLEIILENYKIDIVQLPLSIYDQRFKTQGLLHRLANKKIEVHSRSCFLQGLILIKPENLPKKFNSITRKHNLLYEFCRDNAISPLEASILFSLNQKEISNIIIGFENETQLDEVIRSIKKNILFNYDVFEDFSLDDERIINPSLWK